MKNALNKKIKVYIIIIFLTLSLFMAMFSFEMLAINIIVIGMIIIGFIAPTLSKKSLMVIIIIMIFQNFLIIILSTQLNQQATTLIILYKEIYVYLSIIISLFITNICKSLCIKYKSIFIFGIILLISFLLSPADITVRLISIRQIIIPIVTFIFGYSLIINKKSFDKLIKFIIIIGGICCIFGIIEMYFLPDEFWVNIGINRFLCLKGFVSYISNDLPGNMYTYDLHFWTGEKYRRMVSFFADPLLFAHFISLCIILLMFKNNIIKNKFLKIVTFIVMIFCIVSTFSKGALIIVLCGIMIKFYKKRKSIFISSLIAIIIILSVILTGGKIGSVNNHINGLISNISTVSILGHGVGTAGNFAILYSDVGSDIGLGESMIGAILGQVGVLGLISYLWFYYQMIKKSKTQDKVIITAILIGVLMESFLSESAISFNGSGLYFILVGIISKNSNLQEKNIG